MDVSIPEELVFTLPSGHPSIGVKPIDLLEMELYAVAQQCSEQFKIMAIYPIISQVWTMYNLDSWAPFMELDAKTCGDIALSFHQTIVRNPYFKNTVRAMVENDVTKEDFIWCYTVGLRLHTAIAGHLQSIGTLFDCIAKPIPWINIYLDPGVAEARNMFERHIAKGLPKLKPHSLGTTVHATHESRSQFTSFQGVTNQTTVQHGCRHTRFQCSFPHSSSQCRISYTIRPHGHSSFHSESRHCFHHP